VTLRNQENKHRSGILELTEKFYKDRDVAISNAAAEKTKLDELGQTLNDTKSLVANHLAADHELETLQAELKTLQAELKTLQAELKSKEIELTKLRQSVVGPIISRM
jgi:predicted  nucleic acid-binding Zn-ribbon protein